MHNTFAFHIPEGTEDAGKILYGTLTLYYGNPQRERKLVISNFKIKIMKRVE
jgi:hypothetical protein